jgi:hypothetical protein
VARRPALSKRPARQAVRRKPEPAALAGAEGGEDPEDKPIDQPERGPATADAAFPARESVSVNTLIVRADLGPGVYTLVVGGELIPLGLESLPRVPA